MLGVAMVVYIFAVFAISWWARGQIHDAPDYLVAGRRLPLSLAWATLFATWFGAGTMLTATDEVRAEGLQRAALDPFGAGACLLLAGWFFAARLWNMRLLTLGDFYRRRFGPRAEILFSVLMVPGYFGWIAAQFVALAGVLELFFGLDPDLGILLVAAVGMGYTLMGGMWSVTLTDALQVVLVIVGLVALATVALMELGAGSPAAGMSRLLAETPPEKLVLVPTDQLRSFLVWVGVFLAGALGNLPGQDLMQRVFASKSATVARRACLLGGAAYLLVGLLPLIIGLVGNLLAPDETERAILPFMAHLFLNPWLALIFLLAVMSAVLSTIDSAILAPAGVMAQNLLAHLPQRRFSMLGLNHIAVVFVTLCSLAFAYLGADAYSLLETAYEIGVVALLAPLALGLYVRRGDERAALASMVTGTTLWLIHLALGWDFFLEPLGWPLPNGLTCSVISLVTYLIGMKLSPPAGPAAEVAPEAAPAG
ncbi:MAG: sodium:solute symporter family protein [Gemmatimonadota bacterium]